MSELEAQLREIVDAVWGSTLGLAVGRNDGAAPLEDPTYRATLAFDSETVREVHLACSEAMARRAAAGMFGMSSSDVSAAEMEEVVGELLNIVAGNLRPLVGSPTMGLPVTGASASSGGADDRRVGFESNGMPFQLALSSSEAEG